MSDVRVARHYPHLFCIRMVRLSTAACDPVLPGAPAGVAAHFVPDGIRAFGVGVGVGLGL